MKRYLSFIVILVCTFLVVSCVPNRKGEAVCICKLNGQPAGTYEFGSETITQVQAQCATIQYQNPGDSCQAYLAN
jgi:hypothetical protein